jgi:asparagine synthase (glutamine-hydrolysing)
MFGTSPELFRLHPLFVAEPSIYAVASVLLINHISGGRSLFKGVRRSSPGRYVVWTPENGARETQANPLRMSDASFDVPYQTCLDRVASGFDAFHAPLGCLPQVDIFLSGGQDSRMVAGYVDRHLSRKAVRAVSLGCGDDQELQYARKVSRVFRWTHRDRDVEFEKYASFATTQLRLESLQGPFASFDIGTAQPLLAERGGPVVSGYLGDLVIGDRHILAGRSQQTGEFGFDELFGSLNGYGFNINDAAELLSADDGKLVIAQVIEDLRREWNSIDALPFQKAWMFQMTHRQRFHIGSLIWRLSLGAWPLLPYYDRSLLDAVTSMPLNYLSRRRMQVDIIKHEFPRLATLPLDRNAVGADYLVMPLYRKFLPPVSEVSWRLYQFLEKGRERRYYHRTYDYNSPGWQSVRKDAERHRSKAGNLLHLGVLDRLLPKPDTRVNFRNGVVDASRVKTLLGLVLWNGMNFSKS